jgi:phosphatidylglycerol:prolipoprotein diacylglycerol transferase
MSLTIALAAGHSIIQSETRRMHADPDQIATACVYGLIAALIGSRLFYVFADPGLATYDKLAVFKFWQGGLVFYGGLVSALITVVVYCRKKDMPVARTLDLLAPGVILGQAVGLVGCLLTGCMHGRPCDCPWAVTYREADTMAVWGVALHPAQLYAAAMSAGIFYFLWQRRLQKRFDGEIFWLYLMLDGGSRLVVDHFRGDFQGILFANRFTVSQIIGGILVCLATVVLIKKRAAHAGRLEPTGKQTLGPGSGLR